VPADVDADVDGFSFLCHGYSLLLNSGLRGPSDCFRVVMENDVPLRRLLTVSDALEPSLHRAGTSESSEELMGPNF
jgi:hypothetical protein